MHVLATAGHVDHGKSTLVRALTGMEPDRWAEEHRRGMTIDLGYAWTTLPSGPTLAFVDVPGHQRFIANMLAGLGPAPAVLFVVAADEGWSRQSQEHLAAIDALDVRHGLLAVTRSDLADPQPATDQALARIAASSLGRVDAVAVSGTTHAGLDELRTALERLVAGLPAPDPAQRVRLWIDRSFTVRGSGTVVTGTLAAGAIEVGDTLELRGRRVAVRGLQSLGAEHDRLDAVARVALNLRGVDAAEVARGDVLLSPQAWLPAATLDVRVDTDDSLPTELVLHAGTAAVPVHVRPLAGRHTRITLAAALPLVAGDRAVLRDPGRQSIAAGVLVLDADPPALDRRGAAGRRGAQLTAATGRPDVGVEVGRRGYVRRERLVRLGVDLTEPGEVRHAAGWLVAAGTWRAWVEQLPGVVDDWAAGHPLDPGAPAATVVRALDLPAETELVNAIVTEAGLRAESGRISRPGVSVDLGRGAAGVGTLVARLAGAPFAAPDRDELAALGLGPRELAAAERAGALLRVAPDVVLLPSATSDAAAILRGLPQPFTTSAARTALGTTRRVAVPLLEHLDAQGVTERVDVTTRRVRR